MGHEGTLTLRVLEGQANRALPTADISPWLVNVPELAIRNEGPTRVAALGRRDPADACGRAAWSSARPNRPKA